MCAIEKSFKIRPRICLAQIRKLEMLGNEFRRFRVARVSHVMRGILGEPEARITVLREFGILAGAVEGHLFLAAGD